MTVTFADVSITIVGVLLRTRADVHASCLKVELVQVRQTFTQPLRSGWADCVVLFRFRSDARQSPVMELRLLHQRMYDTRRDMNTVR